MNRVCYQYRCFGGVEDLALRFDDLKQAPPGGYPTSNMQANPMRSLVAIRGSVAGGQRPMHRGRVVAGPAVGRRGRQRRLRDGLDGVRVVEVVVVVMVVHGHAGHVVQVVRVVEVVSRGGVVVVVVSAHYEFIEAQRCIQRRVHLYDLVVGIPFFCVAGDAPCRQIDDVTPGPFPGSRKNCILPPKRSALPQTNFNFFFQLLLLFFF
ncbi:hypothetical protein Btru_025121 [Bulinus truncatus]|nr:hypothetical protein Btru_025121 [Bulinus truncatus]